MSTGNPPRRVLVTGATGFLGRAVLAALGRRPGIVTVAACRDPARLAEGCADEVRVGDLTDAAYRREVVAGVDVVCHCGTWAAFWGHRDLERSVFYEPAADLVEQAVRAGVGRYVQAGTVAAPEPDSGARAGFWPHLDRLVDLDRYMRANSGRGTGMLMLRLGHFVGAGNEIGLVPALVPRLRTRLVPWLDTGRARLPLVGAADLGEAFALAAAAGSLGPYTSLAICGPDFPTAREVIAFVAAETGLPAPRVSVPYGLADAFAWLTEALQPVVPGKAPFLTRSFVHLCRDWWCSGDPAAQALGYRPTTDWRAAVREQLAGRTAAEFPWPRLRQPAPGR